MQPGQKSCERERGKKPSSKEKKIMQKAVAKNKRGYPSKKSAWKKHQPERTPREAPRLRALEKSTQKRSRKKPPKRQKGNMQKAPAKKTNEGNPSKRAHVRRPRERGDRKKSLAKEFSEKRPSIRARQKPRKRVQGKCTRKLQPGQNSSEREHGKSHLQKRKRLCKKQSRKNKREYPTKKSAWKKHQPERTPREAPRLRALKKLHSKRSREKPTKREKANMQKAPAKKQTGISQQKSACKKTA